MKMLQMYETTIMSDDSEHAMHVVVVPKRSQPQGGDVRADRVLEELDLTKLAPTDASSLARHLALVLSPKVPARELPQALGAATQGGAPSFQPTPEDVRFAELMSFERVIPFEESLLSPESLAKLATTATGAGLGAYVGFVAFGSGPLLLIAVPAGMVICGAARGVAQALEEGLRERLLRWLKGEKQESAKKGRVVPKPIEGKAGLTQRLQATGGGPN
jgi:hypothetical protein